jgi:hypothetical protein
LSSLEEDHTGKSDVDTKLDKILSRLSGDKSEASSTQTELTSADYEARKSADDRSNITLKILDLFRLCLVGIGVLVIGNAVSRYNLGSGAPEAEIAILVDLVKSVLMPIVTLILGYYFGQRKT